MIVATGVDVFRTVLLPSSSGVVNRLLSRGLWAAARRAPGRVRTGAMRTSGPLSVVLTTVVWLVVLVVGFALLYLPEAGGLAYSSDARFTDRGLGSALYLSGASLLTLGFGDVVGQSAVVRLLTVVEAGSGLGVLTATLGYLPAMYTLVSELRTANQAVADLGADTPEGAAELLAMDGAAVLEAVRRDVIAARQHLQRFPVLHYFHPQHDESVVALMRGATSLWVAGHFADDEGQPLHRHQKALEMALRRLADELPPHGSRPRAGAEGPDAQELFAQARAASQHPEAAGAGEVSEESCALLTRLHEVLDGYASRHEYPAAKADQA
ncbi:MAG: channel, pore region [Frankiales bacterium]|nr:channel, pore region [Frankiales bacterium]